MKPEIKAPAGAAKTQEPVTAETRSPVNPAVPNERSAGVQQAAGNLAVQRLLRSGAIQTKLAVSQPGDASEREADSVADRIVSGESKTAESPCICNGQSGGDCPRCSAKGAAVQLKTDATAGSSSAPDAGLSFGTGSPLDTTTRAFMES